MVWGNARGPGGIINTSHGIVRILIYIIMAHHGMQAAGQVALQRRGNLGQRPVKMLFRRSVFGNSNERKAIK